MHETMDQNLNKEPYSYVRDQYLQQPNRTFFNHTLNFAEKPTIL